MNSCKSEKWYQYLYYTEHRAVNVERLEQIENVTGHETLDYVLRTLDILEQSDAGEEVKRIVRTVLRWSEVAKGGTARDRAVWEGKGYPLDIHNIASAEIYLDETKNSEMKDEDPTLIHTLIKTHGMIGQCLRGEVPVAGNAPLLEAPVKDQKNIREILYVLNECIIRGVSEELWIRVREEVYALIDRILRGDLSEFPAEYRVRRLLPGLSEVPQELIDFFAEKLFPRYELWYFEAALSDFDAKQILEILTGLVEGMGSEESNGISVGSDVGGHTTTRGVGGSQSEIRYITFKPLADSLYYDYEGKKHINVYKKRIIEKHLRDNSVENVALDIRRRGDAVQVDFAFSRVCEKLIDFCVEAERSGLLTFEKSITVLYDMFGFRRDEFDRLNNEDKYLATMNSTEESTKNSIVDYVAGQTVVDVGSGGGVLLDLLEERYPDKHVIGTDISENVIDVLNKKRVSGGHRWTVERHNFVDGPFLVDGEKGCVDTIIFSSIIHEIFSYTETPEGRFRIEVVEQALRNAMDSLAPGGRIVIRDGVRTMTAAEAAKVPDGLSGAMEALDGSSGAVEAPDRLLSPVEAPEMVGEDKLIIYPDGLLTVTFRDRSGLDFIKNYMQDFEGLTDIEDRRITVDEENLRVSACVDFMREFLYTYTWGRESYSHEVQEQFGYYTIGEYREVLERLGARVLRADAFLEPGYPEHLRPLVTLEPDVYPDSNCIVVAEKQ